MSLARTRSIAEKVSRWQCSKAPECLHCEALKAPQEVEAVERAALDYNDTSVTGDVVWPLLARIAEDTRTRG